MCHMYLFVPSKLLAVHVECPGLSLPLLSPSTKAPNSSPRFCHFSNQLKNCWYKHLYISVCSLVIKYSGSTSVSVCVLVWKNLLCPRTIYFVLSSSRLQAKVLTAGNLKRTKHNRVALGKTALCSHCLYSLRNKICG